MEREDIRDSGILTQYLLGQLPDAEHQRVEKLLLEDEQLMQFYGQMEEDFKQIALENAVPPPTSIKADLFEKLDNEIPQPENNDLPKIVSRPNYLPLAASLTGIFLISTLVFFTLWRTNTADVANLEGQNEELKEEYDRLSTELEQTRKWYTAINLPNTIQLTFRGNEVSPNSSAISFVNHQQKTVILNPQGLEGLSDQQDYQMWADVEGVMVNMGVIPAGEQMVEMEYIEHAESLNITIEPKGGSEHPTVSRLIANVLL